VRTSNDGNVGQIITAMNANSNAVAKIPTTTSNRG